MGNGMGQAPQGNPSYVERWARGPQPTPGFAACQELSQAVFDVAVLGGDGSQARAAELQQLMASLAVGFQTPPLELPFTDYGKAVAARNALGRLAQQSMSRCRAAASAASDPSPDCAVADLLTAAAAASPPLPDSLLVDNLVAAFFGNASTGPSLAKVLQHLAEGEGGGEAVMERLRREQQEVIARHGTDLTAEALDDMPYGAAVAREALRITPAVPAVFRVALVDFELQARRIPKGWRVWCHLGDSVLSYNKDTFVPDRWLQPASQPAAAAAAAAANGGGCPAHAHAGASGAARPEYSIPFGSGVRTCLGRHLVFSELLLVLAVLARGYAWEAVTPGERWRVVPAPAPSNGLLVNLRRL
ncbi:Abscisic acid 8'-hydroxylase 3 [Tetrabaena socialis]|uniref:Abscisic acid 8'-hydroxylase 3 n=1 Tax=Tetrabaena socialis TaxID=47790 RepID=A0A2J8A601_9CHLO|nr:Abscisic acid 8'-hydroxylase 3 [Tetrabaena socialis]|eukprot:PNH07938.1 Abscisic acid 8'-hydroxylase 3 [Tetrabaena socialis]